ncbi:MAG: VWA domain-containing protein, partial [Acidimicrobiia bacterium]
VKDSSHLALFESLFDVYFALTRRPPLAANGAASSEGPPAPSGGGSGGGGGIDPEELLAGMLAAVLDESWLRSLASRAVTYYAGIEPRRPVAGVHYLYRVLRQLDLDGLLSRLLGRSPQLAFADPEMAGSLQERLVEEELRDRLSRLRREIESEIRRRLVADRGPEALARSLRLRLPEDVELTHAGVEELRQIRRAVAPLARVLAARLARRRRHRSRGHLDFRATVRRSLSYGGVPAEPRFRRPHPSKPEIIVLADVSGSVATFARFTLQLVHALSSQFSRVRSFAFVDGIDEVTSCFEEARDPDEAFALVGSRADVVWADGHSDYGHVLSVFVERFGDQVTKRTSVVVLGDARNNYHEPAAWALDEVRRRARHLYWLNPEPRGYWDSGDSVVSRYAPHCDGFYECRNLRQLERFVISVID